mmetsp:Transcript_8661/g.26663  ORF Transcript_8661/g.26663 Transcript_8661/m.26663 type:complete len:241 (+) Transcript_8661:3-725(+)
MHAHQQNAWPIATRSQQTPDVQARGPDAPRLLGRKAAPPPRVCSAAKRSKKPSAPVDKIQAQGVHRLFVLLQVDADADEVSGASGLATLAANAVLDTGRGCNLLGGVHGGRSHLQHVRGASAHAECAANASVIDLHGVRPACREAAPLRPASGGAQSHCADCRNTREGDTLSASLLGVGNWRSPVACHRTWRNKGRSARSKGQRHEAQSTRQDCSRGEVDVGVGEPHRANQSQEMARGLP